MIIDGTKLKPNETQLKFFANGFYDKSSFLSTYIEKCNDQTKKNALYQNLVFNNVTCAPSSEIDQFVNKLNVEIFFDYHEIDI